MLKMATVLNNSTPYVICAARFFFYRKKLFYYFIYKLVCSYVVTYGDTSGGEILSMKYGTIMGCLFRLR